MPPSRAGSGARLGSFTKCIDAPLVKMHGNDTASLLPWALGGFFHANLSTSAEVNTEYQVQLMCWWPAIENVCCFGGVELPCFNDIELS